jgi:phosphoglycolate phosphatase-like HAD superfamily hydrolase
MMESGGTMLRYKCILLDHDDTIVESTKEIHYPSFLETLRTLRPEEEAISLHDFVSLCYHPGFLGLCDKYGFDKEEMVEEYTIWKKYTRGHIPAAYPGIKEILLRFREEGGLIVVISHSESTEILRDYRQNFGFDPDLVYGWELGEDKRKPYTYPLDDAMLKLNLKNTDCIMIDDLKLGMTMVRQRNIPFIAAGWSHFIDKIKDELKVEADYYCAEVSDLIPILFTS